MDTTANDLGANFMTFVNRHTKAIIFGFVALVFFVLVFGAFTSTNNKGVQYEQQLNQAYVDNQNYLSAFISGFHEQVSVAKTAGAELDKVLLDAVKGRYENGGYQVNSPFFNAIREAYPEASTQQLVAIWGNIQTYIAGQREGYRNVQSKLLDMIRNYQTWRISFPNNIITGVLGFPSQNLVAQIGSDRTVRGIAALDRMNQIILTSQALDAYQNGTLDPLQP